MPGAAEPGVQLPLEIVGDLRSVPVELVHGRDDDVQYLCPLIGLDGGPDGDWPGGQPGHTVGVHDVGTEIGTWKQRLGSHKSWS